MSLLAAKHIFRRSAIRAPALCQLLSLSLSPSSSLSSLSSSSLTSSQLSTTNTLRNQKSPNPCYYSQQHLRWRHSGKMGHMKEELEELAHRPEREAAQERRQKKKEKTVAKKKKGKKGDETSSPVGAAAASGSDVLEDEDDDLDFSDLEDDGHDGGNEEEEPSLPNLAEVEVKMMAYVDRFQESLKSIRWAEPTAEMFDDIQVMAYGSTTPLKAVGQVVIVSPTMAQITCFDPAVANDVQKAIQLSLDQLNPQLEDGGSIRVPLPRVSMEVREQTARQLKKKAEATKQRIRQVRRKAHDVVNQGKDGKLAGISKDDAFAAGKELDTLTESVTKKLQKLVDEKLESIMAV